MLKQTINSGFLLAALTATAPVMAIEYGCPTGTQAAQLAEDFNQRWRQSIDSGQSAQTAELYTENAILMPPTDETIVGRAPIGEYLKDQSTTSSLGNYSVDIVACDLDGDTLNVAGVWGAEQVNYRGEAIAMTGNLMRVLDRNDDGSWALRFEIWN